MVEMVRQAIGKLEKILAEEYDLNMPKNLSLQFDNFGENKVV